MKNPLKLHPPGVVVCAATELWERFSYYGMQALLIFYLTQHLGFSDARSFEIYGAYTALAWGLPVLGGMIADRYLGPRRAVVMGAVLLSCGHLLMAVEGPPAESMAAGDPGARDAYLGVFFLAVALIVSGVGFLKTNISTVVGLLYGPSDRRRESGFTLFYLGINVGAALAPLLCGWLGQTWGWRYGFGLAGIGMLAGLLTFLRGQRHFREVGEAPDVAYLETNLLPGLSRERVVQIGALAIVGLGYLLLQHHDVLRIAFSVCGVLLIAGLLWFSVYRCDASERAGMFVSLVLILFAVAFWSLYMQMGSSLNLFAERLVDRRVLGVEVQASQLQALPGNFVILLAPLFSMLWTRLESRMRNPSVPAKFAIALLLVGASFLMPVIGAALVDPGEKIGVFWFAAIFFLMVCGELCMVPIAMNMITVICPRRVVGVMMGTYFLSLAVGNLAASELAKLTSVADPAVLLDIDAATAHYVASFCWFAVAGIACGIVLLILAPMLVARLDGRSTS